MDMSILDDHLHHHLIPHREQSTSYGISSSSSVHLQAFQVADKFPPPAIEPSTFWHHHPALPPFLHDNQMAITLPDASFPPYHYDSQDGCAQPGGREKRHCCLLCNKRFDRPSTLKKHMLVHTGEKAWACDICSRRFSVSSNLNRHIRRCREKWGKSDSSATDTPPPPPSTVSEPSESTGSPPSSYNPSPSPPSTDGPVDAYRPPSPQLTDQQKRRHSTPGLVQYESDYGTRPHDQRHVAGKRRRRGSPTEPWVPASLANFNLEPAAKSASAPLPAVVPGTCEERNSYADTPSQAYHPACWTGNLVGPSYVPKSEDMSRGRYCGKLLVF